jgi:type IV secretion system protein TrbI
VSFSVGLGCGQSCALLVWTRVIMPNADRLSLNASRGRHGGIFGASGRRRSLAGELFKVALLSTLLSVGAELGSDAGNGDSAVLRRFAVWAGTHLIRPADRSA